MTYHTFMQDLLCFHNSDPTTILEKKNHYIMTLEVFCYTIIKDKTFSFSDM